MTFTGVTIFFQDNFKVLATTTDLTLTNLSVCKEQVESYREQLSAVLTELNTTEQDVEKYDILYSKKVAELASLEEEKQKVERNLQLANVEKERLKKLYEDERLARQKDQREYEKRIQDLNDLVDSLRDEIDNLEDDLAACQAG
ncbi:hypothetical protein D6783_04290 [Candidatus Woesearchaeota archaeon]|nr:MAG: hypothetical protein D6783_04290 [Candidatus Woesearchaeota archaeon]